MILAVDGATVFPFAFGAKSQFSPSSRCGGLAFPLSVQECEHCITSVVLPAAKERLRPGGLSSLLSLALSLCGGLKGVCVFFLLYLEVEISDGEERKREAAHDSSPLQYEELVKKQKGTWISTTLSRSRWRNQEVKWYFTLYLYTEVMLHCSDVKEHHLSVWSAQLTQCFYLLKLGFLETERSGAIVCSLKSRSQLNQYCNFHMRFVRYTYLQARLVSFFADKCYCVGCRGKIQDSFQMKVLQDTWHNACFK